MLDRIARYALCAALLSGAALSFAPEARAQSAADKATARQLATEGIKLYGAGKYPEALDNLQRAQSLYDAPVHLLYLARTHAKLGNLVESAETYRRLQRVQLEPGAPKAFKEAVGAADKELAEVEPRIPALRIDIEPAGVQGLELRIDGEPVSAAAVGVDRPVNPGERKVTVSAPGYSKAEASVTVAEAEKKKLALKLVPGEGPPPAGAGAMPGQPGPAVGGDQGAGGTVEPAQPPSSIGFMVGLRLGGAIPSGTAYVSASGEEVAINDEFGTGFGGELHGGVRFLKYFTGVLFIEAYSLRPGSALDEISASTLEAVEVTNTTSTSGGGIGVLIGTERGRFGGFGEIGLLPVHNFDITREVDLTTQNVRCTANVTLKGAAIRVGGGLVIPVARFLNLTPYIMATFGRIGSSTTEDDCPATPEVDDFINQHTVEEGSSHQVFVLGVGGDFLLGRDAP